MSDGAGRIFSFVQFEFPWALGPGTGRYVVRMGQGEEPSAVVVIAAQGAEQKRFMRRRRPSSAAPEPGPAPVLTSKVTLIAAEPLAGEDAGKAWLSEASGDPDDRLEAALVQINSVIRVHRAAAADPYAREVSREQALVSRLGFGGGDQVADGRWTAAVEVPFEERRSKRSAALHPQGRLAAVLGGRDRVLACEELILRARLDVDSHHLREAALQLRVAIEAALTELDPQQAADMPARLDELRGSRAAVGAAANEAVGGELSAESAQTVERVLSRVEAALRARSVATDRAS